VRYVLEGSVRRVGESITINAQLISTETGAHVWADRFDGERGKLGELQVEVVSRLANSLGAELVKAEALRSTRERRNNPDSTDLAMRGQAALYRNSDDAMSLFEQALALDPRNARALTGLTNALVWRSLFYLAVDPAKAASDAGRAEKLIDEALSLQPDNSQAHVWKGWVYFLKQQWASALAEASAAIADDPNNANAYSVAGFWKLFMGRGEDGFAGVEHALRLSPHDPFVPNWQYWICHLHTHLAQWERAIEWCSKSIANGGRDMYSLVDLAAANAWASHDKEAKDAAAQLQKVNPDFTVQGWAGIHWTDDPTFNTQYARIVEGLRKAGVSEGEKKTD
jgi:adenylate cyclase